MRSVQGADKRGRRREEGTAGRPGRSSRWRASRRRPSPSARPAPRRAQPPPPNQIKKSKARPGGEDPVVLAACTTALATKPGPDFCGNPPARAAARRPAPAAASAI
ncbi:hypothetical protein PVAP13_5KG116387 [Panicum virgatum]|uniref:Uncharacterized protein n=1 Tax=Panicum virgatum TaxID=38727 RepID=A0A8T0SEN9_PANVG|nr:hypothetical protein PVAP13_5KG116387 [Panicum virgatum]